MSIEQAAAPGGRRRRSAQLALRLSGVIVMTCVVASHFALQTQWLCPWMRSVGVASGAGLIFVAALIGVGKSRVREAVATSILFAMLCANAVLELRRAGSDACGYSRGSERSRVPPGRG